MFKKILFYILSILCILGVFFCMIFGEISTLSIVYKILISSGVVILFSLNLLFKWFNLQVLSKISITSFVILSIFAILYTIMYRLNLLYIFSSVTTLKDYILSTQEKGVFVYILIQFLQVVFLPIPASVICIAGSLIYGGLLGAVYCSIGVLLGSYVSYTLGRVFGYRLVSWIVGKDNTDKYSDILRKRGGFFLALAFLLPMFPDDILCFIAGVTKMSFRKFFWITFVTRPIGVICMAFFGGGYIIPFTGWGIYAWAVILVLAVASVVVVYKWQDNIENFILNKVFKRKRNKN